MQLVGLLSTQRIGGVGCFVRPRDLATWGTSLELLACDVTMVDLIIPSRGVAKEKR